MIMHWPQIAVLVLYVLSVGVHLARHGQPRDGKYNFIGSLVMAVILLSLMYAGGFFGGVE